jgi:hypothetical protein
MSAIIKIPWLFVNSIYSTFFYFSRKSYCPKCGWKYFPSHGQSCHDAEECSYNQEYNLIEKEVFSGKVFIDLDPIHKISEQKIKAGKESALYDLLHRNLPWEKLLDMGAILVSILVYLYFLAILAMPVFNEIYQFDAIF